MNRILWRWPDLPLEKKQLELVEKTIKKNFPDDFKNIIYEANGSCPSPNNISVSNRDDAIVNNFLTLNSKSDDQTLLEAVENVVKYNNCLVPFAADPFGNYFCFIYDSNNLKIIFWDFEKAATGQDNIYYIANSFADFLGKLF